MLYCDSVRRGLRLKENVPLFDVRFSLISHHEASYPVIRLNSPEVGFKRGET